MLRTVVLVLLAAVAPGCTALRSGRSEPIRTYVVSELSVAPKLLNLDEVRCEVLSLGPLALRYAGSGGTAVLDLTVDSRGRVERVGLFRSSGREPVDRAALRVATVMRFSPGRLGRAAVPARFTLPLALDIQDAPLPLPPPHPGLRGACE